MLATYQQTGESVDDRIVVSGSKGVEVDCHGPVVVAGRVLIVRHLDGGAQGRGDDVSVGCASRVSLRESPHAVQDVCHWLAECPALVPIFVDVDEARTLRPKTRRPLFNVPFMSM